MTYHHLPDECLEGCQWFTSLIEQRSVQRAVGKAMDRLDEWRRSNPQCLQHVGPDRYNGIYRAAVSDYHVGANLERHLRAAGLTEISARTYMSSASSLDRHPFWRLFLLAPDSAVCACRPDFRGGCQRLHRRRGSVEQARRVLGGVLHSDSGWGCGPPKSKKTGYSASSTSGCSLARALRAGPPCDRRETFLVRPMAWDFRRATRSLPVAYKILLPFLLLTLASGLSC